MLNNFVAKLKPLRGIAIYYSCQLSTVTYQLFSFLYICRGPSTNRLFFAKQTQFLKMQNEHDPLNNKELRKQNGTVAQAKTNPNKPNL